MNYLKSSVGRKHLVGISGLGVSLFALTHMLGNFLIFLGSDAYNQYAYALTSNKLFLYTAEAGLLAMFVIHAVVSIWLKIQSRRARPIKYKMVTSGQKRAEFGSKTMAYQGIALLVFIVLHLITFKYGPYYDTTVNGVVMRDLHRLVVEVFQSPAYVIGYVISMIIIAIHLSHGFSSSFQSLGFHHPDYTPKLRVLSVMYGILIGLGFMSQPIYVYLFH